LQGGGDAGHSNFAFSAQEWEEISLPAAEGKGKDSKRGRAPLGEREKSHRPATVGRDRPANQEEGKITGREKGRHVRLGSPRPVSEEKGAEERVRRKESFRGKTSLRKDLKQQLV